MRIKHSVKVEFNSIGQAVKSFEGKETNSRSFDINNLGSQLTGFEAKRFTQTEDFNEALTLLNRGWSEGAKQLTSSLKVANLKMGNVERQKMYNDIVGFQVHVPNYIQGIPTSMINKKNVKQKQRTITLVKSIAYPSRVKADEILKDSVKFLQIVQAIEKQGIKVNVFTVFHSIQNSEEIVIKIKIKSANERLNISKMSFPLMHPSFLRRIVIRIMEINHDLKLTGWHKGYGFVAKDQDTRNYLKEKEVLIPTLISDTEATNIIERSIQ